MLLKTSKLLHGVASAYLAVKGIKAKLFGKIFASQEMVTKALVLLGN